jgi:hypothetical protein
MKSPLDTFAQTARAFCTWVESDQHNLDLARKILLELMSQIPSIQEIQTEYSHPEPEVVEHKRRRHEGWKQDIKRFKDLPFQYYWMVSALYAIYEHYRRKLNATQPLIA